MRLDERVLSVRVSGLAFIESVDSVLLCSVDHFTRFVLGYVGYFAGDLVNNDFLIDMRCEVELLMEVGESFSIKVFLFHLFFYVLIL